MPTAFRRVNEIVYYRQTPGFTAEIQPGIWEEQVLLDRLGPERLELLQRTRVIVPLAGAP